MKLYKEIEELDKQIEKLRARKDEVINLIRKACSHPPFALTATGYDSPDGYGGGSWVKTGFCCTVCGTQLPPALKG